MWLSPIFPSPMADFGYDVADYCGVDPLFGDLPTFDRLLAAVHARGLKLLLDFVPNHSSTAHPSLVENRSSRTSPRRDWYFWRDPAPGGGPPNNWVSDMGGSAWEFDPATGQYYLHTFLKEQADLDWRNPAVVAAMMDVMRFWFDRGVDGFRIDVLWHIVKAAELPDNPANPDWREGMAEKLSLIQANSTDQPEAHGTAAMRALADDYGGRLLVGEIFLPRDRLMRWYGTSERGGVHLPFNFELIENPWDRDTLARLIPDYDAGIPAHGWPNWVIGGHDAPRIAARIGNAGAGGGDAAADAARHPDALSGRRTRHRVGGHPARPHPRSAGPAPAGAGAGSRPFSARRWRGMRAPMPVLRPSRHGCRSIRDWATRNVAAPRRSGVDAVAVPRPAGAAAGAGARSGHDAGDRRAGGGARLRTRRRRRLTVLLNMTGAAVAVEWGGTPLLSTLQGPPEPGLLRADEGMILA
ncbi:alpha-amylase family glycosyl hydrolase [Sphingomonas sp. MMS24-JH45]